MTSLREVIITFKILYKVQIGGDLWKKKQNVHTEGHKLVKNQIQKHEDGQRI